MTLRDVVIVCVILGFVFEMVFDLDGVWEFVRHCKAWCGVFESLSDLMGPWGIL